MPRGTVAVVMASVEIMMDEMFTLSNRQQMTLTLTRDRTLEALENARGLPGVLTVEGGYAVPVRLAHGPRQSLQSLQARSDDAELVRVLDRERRPVAMPDHGLVLPELLAEELKVREGDLIAVEFFAGERETHILPVSAVAQQTLGEAAYIRDEALFALLRHEPRVNQINLLHSATPLIAGVCLISA